LRLVRDLRRRQHAIEHAHVVDPAVKRQVAAGQAADEEAGRRVEFDAAADRESTATATHHRLH